MILFFAALGSLLLGTTYDASIKGTEYDPLIASTNAAAVAEFESTLSGPQKPAIQVEVDGRSLMVFETCMLRMCAEQHAVIAIDVESGETYAAAYAIDGSKHELMAAPFAPLIDQHCAEVACDFEAADQRGEFVRGEPITLAEAKSFPEITGGAHCAAYQDGNLILYTEGVGVMRYKGELRRLAEDGIGSNNIYTDDDLEPLSIEIVVLRTLEDLYESVLSQAYINVYDGEWKTIAVDMKCEA